MGLLRLASAAFRAVLVCMPQGVGLQDVLGTVSICWAARLQSVPPAFTFGASCAQHISNSIPHSCLPSPRPSYPSDDINKFLWMVRIGGGVFPDIKESNYLSSDGALLWRPPSVLNAAVCCQACMPCRACCPGGMRPQ